MHPPRILLGVNIDHIATLRQARGTRYPDPVQAALLAEEAGADGITVHLREDRRHIQPRDVRLLAQQVQAHSAPSRHRRRMQNEPVEEACSPWETIAFGCCCSIHQAQAQLAVFGAFRVCRSRAQCFKLGTASSLLRKVTETSRPGARAL